MRDLERLNKFRIHPEGMHSKPEDTYGWFVIPGPFGVRLYAMASPIDDEWDHVSISTKNRCPNWPEMCLIKDLFYGFEARAIQYHPPEKDYVDNAKYCLHLWRWTKGEFPAPPMELVGMKTNSWETNLGDSLEENH